LSGTADTSKKKGSVYSSSATNAATLIREVNPNWFYTWSAINKVGGNLSIPFVPMIWGANDVAKYASKLPSPANGGSPYLLGFNEPDGDTQSNITVSRALELWPQLETTPFLLGSPATAGNPTTSGSWLELFLAGEPGKAPPRVDFIALHWYAPPKASSFLTLIDGTL